MAHFYDRGGPFVWAWWLFYGGVMARFFGCGGSFAQVCVQLHLFWAHLCKYENVSPISFVATQSDMYDQRYRTEPNIGTSDNEPKRAR